MELSYYREFHVFVLLNLFPEIIYLVQFSLHSKSALPLYVGSALFMFTATLEIYSPLAEARLQDA